VPLWRRLYASCDGVVAHSESGRRRLVEEVGVDPARVAVIPHALFTRLAAPVAARPSGPPTILFFGLLRPDKGLDTLLEALPLVAREVPDVRLSVVGSPRMDTGPLHRAAEALGVAGRVRFDERFVADEEIGGVFAAADVVALPYRAIEGSGVLATALAAGVPPVVTAVGSFPELVRAYDLGEPAPVDDAPALARGLVRLLVDDAARARALAGMARAREELAWPRAAELTEALYRRLLAGEPAAT
jgi:glycosyltransferase involved in cell wall biosynthesis